MSSRLPAWDHPKSPRGEVNRKLTYSVTDSQIVEQKVHTGRGWGVWAGGAEHDLEGEEDQFGDQWRKGWTWGAGRGSECEVGWRWGKNRGLLGCGEPRAAVQQRGSRSPWAGAWSLAATAPLRWAPSL